MNYNNIPAELKAVPAWVCWQAYPDPKSHSGVKKVPINPRTGGHAQSNNPDTWADFNTAVSASSRYSGIGFVFSGSGYFGVDIDDMPDELEKYRSGDTDNVIAEFINTLRSYTEYSQSGNGIHIICRGELPQGRRRKQGFEMYDSGRFFVMTGKICAEYTGVADCTKTIKPLHAKYIGGSSTRELPTVAPRPAAPEITPISSGSASDAELIQAATSDPRSGAVFARLWCGDTSDYNNDSSLADFRLCEHLAILTGCDADRIDRLFRQSGLMRGKWDRRQSGTTYGAITVQNAVEKCKNRDLTTSQLPDFTFDDMCRYTADDIGTAGLFAKLTREFLRYCYEEKCFYLFDGVRWRQDVVKEHLEAGTLLMNFIVTARKLIPAPPEGSPKDWAPDEAERERINKAYRQQYHSLGNANGRERVMKDVKKHLKISRTAFDRQPYLLNCLNCTVNLDTGEVQPHAAADLITRVCNAEYHGDATSERFERFIDEICESNDEQKTALQIALGYSLIGSAPEECFFLAFGKSTRNGKGTLFDLVLDTLGDYGVQLDFDTIARSGTKDGSRATPDLARLVGVRYVLANEPQKGVCLNEGLVKQITGSDDITARPLYGAVIQFKPAFTLFVTTNSLPAIADASLFESDRVRILPFNRHFSKSERDTHLKAKLREGSGRDAVLRWLIDGYRMYRDHGLIDTAAADAVLRQYRSDNDYIQQFIDECLIVPDQSNKGAHKERLTNIMARYNEWCRYSNLKPLGKKLFREELEKHGIWVGYPHGQYYARVTIRPYSD